MLAKPKLKAASTFFDKNTAVACVNSVIAANEAEIEDWLNGDPKIALALDGSSDDNVGIIVKKSGETVHSRHYRVVLISDATMPDGFRVLTAYPAHP